MKYIPPFFEDNSENKDHEIMLDYFLGWTLRCSQEITEDERLKAESKKVLSFILFEKQETFIVESVKIWKQWRQIDLCAEVVISREPGKSEKYAILFENKMWTHIHSNQLEKYRTIFDQHYENKPDFIKKYIFLTCFFNEEDYKDDLLDCRKNKFDLISFGWLKYKNNLSETGNYMFDEFWFKYWK